MIKYNFAERALLKNSKVNVLGNYVCSSEKIEVCCKKCGYIKEKILSFLKTVTTTGG